jgi:hypothetical protein
MVASSGDADVLSLHKEKGAWLGANQNAKILITRSGRTKEKKADLMSVGYKESY